MNTGPLGLENEWKWHFLEFLALRRVVRARSLLVLPRAARINRLFGQWNRKINSAGSRVNSHVTTRANRGRARGASRCVNELRILLHCFGHRATHYWRKLDSTSLQNKTHFCLIFSPFFAAFARELSEQKYRRLTLQTLKIHTFTSALGILFSTHRIRRRCTFWGVKIDQQKFPFHHILHQKLTTMLKPLSEISGC